jgi:hypothetical protein
MRLSDAGHRCPKTKLIYLNHRLPPWLTEDATRDRSNRLLDALRETRLVAEAFNYPNNARFLSARPIFRIANDNSEGVRHFHVGTTLEEGLRNETCTRGVKLHDSPPIFDLHERRT